MTRAAQLDRFAGLGALGLDAQVALPAELLDRALRHVRRQGLAVPAILVLDLAEALALDRPGDDHGRLAPAGARLAERLVDLGGVVAVDDDRPASEGPDPGGTDGA